MILQVVEGTLFLLLLVYALLATSLPLAGRLVGRDDALARALAVATLVAFQLTLLFHLLLPFSAFDRPRAALALLVLLAGARLSGARHAALARDLRRDLDGLLRCLRAPRTVALRLVLAAASGLVVVTTARALMLPTVAWDSLTYHFVKAGIWVQSGGPIALDAPGGWGLYRGIFGGGEIFTAWAMLPFGNDLLAGAVDVAGWALCALALAALCRELGLRPRDRESVVVYACFVPAVWDAVGWGYVDLTNNALSLMGLAFAVRFLRRRDPACIGLAMLALGLASGVKLTSLPFFLLTAAAALAAVARDARDRPRRFGALLLGGLAGSLAVVPWVLANLLESGYPLRMPLAVGSLQLGPSNPAFDWYQDRDVGAYAFATEWLALRALFPLPVVNESHLSALSLLPIALAPWGAVRLFRSRAELRLSIGLLLGLALATLGFFYSPNFSFSRLTFTWHNGRFLAPILFLALPLAFAALPSRGRWRDLLAGYLLLATLVHLALFGFLRITQPSIPLVLGGSAALAVCLGLAPALRLAPSAWRVAGAVVMLLAAVVGLSELRTPKRRYRLLANRNVSTDFFRYWWVAAYMLEQAGPHRVAVTAGPSQDADNWLLYYFLGRDLQNTLHYVPISADGSFVPFGPDERRREEGDAAAWARRLREQRISHVLALYPGSVELLWMNERPDQFRRLTGHENDWALFRVLPPAPR